MTKTLYAADKGAVDARWSGEMTPGGERQSAGDPDARFQRGKHGNRSAWGYEVFFSTDRKQGKGLRGIIAEGKFAEAVRHGLKTIRYVGKHMAVLQATLVAFILNVKRCLRVEAQGIIT